MEDTVFTRRKILTAGLAAGLVGPAALSFAGENTPPTFRVAEASG